MYKAHIFLMCWGKKFPTVCRGSRARGPLVTIHHPGSRWTSQKQKWKNQNQNTCFAVQIRKYFVMYWRQKRHHQCDLTCHRPGHSVYSQYSLFAPLVAVLIWRTKGLRGPYLKSNKKDFSFCWNGMTRKTFTFYSKRSSHRQKTTNSGSPFLLDTRSIYFFFNKIWVNWCVFTYVCRTSGESKRFCR